MHLERKCVSEESIGSLRSCLVEGDAEFEQRARKGKRRALVFSIAFQTVIVAALVLFPLLSKGERILLSDHWTIMPPFVPSGAVHPAIGTHPPKGGKHVCVACFHSPHLPPVSTTSEANTNASDPILDGISGSPEGPGVLGGLLSPEKKPKIPEAVRNQPPGQRIIIGHIEPAMLTRRVEPVYPSLAVHLHREGRVELHAIIAEDGSIQELEVISGDTLLIHSALAAVREWHYKPTILNGKAVQVDTHITVVYTLSRN
jgi:periplasmic protein TonB